MRGVLSWLTNTEPPDIHTFSYHASETLKQAYIEQSTIGWGHFLRGRLSMKWGDMIHHEYQQISTRLNDLNIKPHKHRSPESWAKGLIMINWEFVIDMWESRIESIKQTPIGVEPIDNLHYLRQKALHALSTHQITNARDQEMIIKSESDIAILSQNQIKLWLANLQTLNKINKLENEMGTSEPTPMSDLII